MQSVHSYNLGLSVQSLCLDPARHPCSVIIVTETPWAYVRDPVTQINVHARRQAEFAVLLVTTTTLNVSTMTRVAIRLLYVIYIRETMHRTKY